MNFPLIVIAIAAMFNDKTMNTIPQSVIAILFFSLTSLLQEKFNRFAEEISHLFKSVNSRK